MPLPGGDQTQMAADAKAARGSMLLVETAQAGFLPAPKGDWEQRRFGADFPQAVVMAQQRAHDRCQRADLGRDFQGLRRGQRAKRFQALRA